MYIYKITNTVNNKTYIGQTIHPIQDRFNRHITDALHNIIDTHFARAIRKHGADKFHIEQIDTAVNQDELTQKEQQWIRHYQSTNPNYGYNETDAIYKCGGNTYQSKTDDELKKICKKISKTKLGGLNPRAKKVKCLNVDTGQELVFDSFSLCKKYFNEQHHRFITTRVLHQIHSLYKGKWAIAYYEDDYYQFNKIPTTRNGCLYNVYDKNTCINKLFPSVTKMCQHIKQDRKYLGKLLKQNLTIELDNYIISVLN